MPVTKKSNSNNGASVDVLPPPIGVSARVKESLQPSHTKKGGNVRGQVAMHFTTALIKSPEMAGRFTTHDAFKQAVKEDVKEFLQFFDEEELF